MSRRAIKAQPLIGPKITNTYFVKVVLLDGGAGAKILVIQLLC